MMEDISAPSLEQKSVDATTTDADEFGVTVEKKLTSEVTETVTVTGMLCFTSLPSVLGNVKVSFKISTCKVLKRLRCLANGLPTEGV